jgi:hypothetical protein
MANTGYEKGRACGEMRVYGFWEAAMDIAA